MAVMWSQAENYLFWLVTPPPGSPSLPMRRNGHPQGLFLPTKSRAGPGCFHGEQPLSVNQVWRGLCGRRKAPGRNHLLPSLALGDYDYLRSIARLCQFTLLLSGGCFVNYFHLRQTSLPYNGWPLCLLNGGRCLEFTTCSVLPGLE